MTSEFWLTDEQFERFRPRLPSKLRGVPWADNRSVISGIIHALISGGRWIDAPAVHGPRKALCNRWSAAPACIPSIRNSTSAEISLDVPSAAPRISDASPSDTTNQHALAPPP